MVFITKQPLGHKAK